MNKLVINAAVIFLCLLFNSDLSAQRGQIQNTVKGKQINPHNPEAVRESVREERQFDLLFRFATRNDKNQDFDLFVQSERIMDWQIPKDKRSYEACIEGAKNYLISSLKDNYMWRKMDLPRSNDITTLENQEYFDSLADTWSHRANEDNIISSKCRKLSIDYDEIMQAAMTEEERKVSASILKRIIESDMKGGLLLYNILKLLISPHSEKDISELAEWIEKNRDKETLRLALIYIAQDPVSTQIVEKLGKDEKDAMLPSDVKDSASFMKYLESSPPEQELMLLTKKILDKSSCSVSPFIYECALDEKGPMNIRECIVDSMLKNSLNRGVVVGKLLRLPANDGNTTLKKRVFQYFIEHGIGSQQPDAIFEVIANKDEDLAIRQLAVRSLISWLAEYYKIRIDLCLDEKMLDEYADAAEKVKEKLNELIGDKDTPEALSKTAEEALKDPVLVPTTPSELCKLKIDKARESMRKIKERGKIGANKEEIIQKFKKNYSEKQIKEGIASLELLESLDQSDSESDLGKEQLKLFYYEIVGIAEKDGGKLPESLDGLKLSSDYYDRPLYFPVKTVEQLSDRLLLAVNPKSISVLKKLGKKQNILLAVSGKGRIIRMDDSNFKDVMSKDADARKNLGLAPIDEQSLLSLLNK